MAPLRNGPDTMEMPRFWHPRMNWVGPAGIGIGTGFGIAGFRNCRYIFFLNGMPNWRGGMSKRSSTTSSAASTTPGWTCLHGCASSTKPGCRDRHPSPHPRSEASRSGERHPRELASSRRRRINLPADSAVPTRLYRPPPGVYR